MHVAVAFIGVCGEGEPPYTQLPLSRCFRSWHVIWGRERDTNQARLELRASGGPWLCKTELSKLERRRFLSTAEQLLRGIAVELKAGRQDVI